MSPATKLATGSIGVGAVVFALKWLAWWLTGSVALYSDAIESIINVVAAIAALYAVNLAQKPPDREHPYGHHKAEYFAAVLEGTLILVAAVAILSAAWKAYLSPRLIDAPWQGMALNLVAGCINAGWCAVLLKQGRKLRSPALIADGRHLWTDVVSSFGVLLGLSLAIATGLSWLDPVLACIVALNIVWSGLRLIQDSVSGLMDEAAHPGVMASIKEAIAAHGEGALEAHDLRSRVAGNATFIEFHLVVPGQMTVSRSHEICDRLEAAIRHDVEGAVVTIHVEPAAKAKPGEAVQI